MTFYCNSVIAAQLSGEVVALASVLGGFFHQDAYCSGDEVLSDMEVFRRVRVLHDEYERGQLISDLSVLISEDHIAVVSFWNAHAGCHNYDIEDAAEAREFLPKFPIQLAPATKAGASNGYIWQHAATVAIAIFGAGFLFRGFNPGDSREIYRLRDLPVMRHSHNALYISCAAGVLFAASAGFMAWSVYLPWQSWKFLALLGLSLLALYRVLRFFFERIELTDDGIVIRSLWRGNRELRWVHLRTIACDESPRFKLTFDPGGMAMVSVLLTGTQQFARKVLTRARHSIADEETREILLQLAADEDVNNLAELET